jgi:hypothetical protein
MKNTTVGIIFGLLAGVFIGLNLEDQPNAQFVIDKSKQSVSGMIAKFRPSKPGEPPKKPEIESIEVYNSVLQNDTSSTPAFKKNEFSYIPKYNFGDNKVYHSIAYQYAESARLKYGGYLAENKELGLVLSFSW